MNMHPPIKFFHHVSLILDNLQFLSLAFFELFWHVFKVFSWHEICRRWPSIRTHLRRPLESVNPFSSIWTNSSSWPHTYLVNIERGIHIWTRTFSKLPSTRRRWDLDLANQSARYDKQTNYMLSSDKSEFHNIPKYIQRFVVFDLDYESWIWTKMRDIYKLLETLQTTTFCPYGICVPSQSCPEQGKGAVVVYHGVPCLYVCLPDELRHCHTAQVVFPNSIAMTWKYAIRRKKILF